ncbi:hypothetical protein T265_11092 [Opisthorchis viverrini]|uniref:Uncharacterized protein n=1 Tax=Opisthorchis viverrini TaxID=6198 RepID=A0A074Z497_OPIVI|nr:hypothetical protein T265_11092 [Opisthorchis viverrini]KER20342.1 hypothetical protein T265_11092 [Opisthorchis viverrini]
MSAVKEQPYHEIYSDFLCSPVEVNQIPSYRYFNPQDAVYVDSNQINWQLRNTQRTGLPSELNILGSCDLLAGSLNMQSSSHAR